MCEAVVVDDKSGLGGAAVCPVVDQPENQGFEAFGTSSGAAADAGSEGVLADNGLSTELVMPPGGETGLGRSAATGTSRRLGVDSARGFCEGTRAARFLELASSMFKFKQSEEDGDDDDEYFNDGVGDASGMRLAIEESRRREAVEAMCFTLFVPWEEGVSVADIDSVKTLGATGLAC